MQTDSTNKYKMFRNFMVNELGIGRDDLKAWTQEAIKGEVEKLVGQLNVAGMVDNAIRQAIRGPYHQGMSDQLLKIVREAIAAEIAGRIVFKNPEAQ